MRKVSIALVFLAFCLCVSAQTRKPLDSLEFILPQFGQGSVMFADKHFSRGLVNISPVDQMVYCISSEGDTLTVVDNASILSVSAAGRSFVRWKDSFVEAVVTNGDTGVGIIRSTTIVDNVKTGAYGMANSTSSIKTYSVDVTTGVMKRHVLKDRRNYSYKQTACLYRDGKYYSVSKKSFEKLFPGQKAYIESVWNDLKLNAADIDEVIDFYNELLKK